MINPQDIKIAPSGPSYDYHRTITLDSATLQAIQAGNAVIVVHGDDPSLLSPQAQGEKSDIPGTESLPRTLAQPWPVCRFRAYNPYTLSDAAQTVNGVPCVLGYTPRDLTRG